MGESKTGCDPTVHEMRRRISSLESENIRLRATVIQRDSELAFARQDCAALTAASTGLPRRIELARRVDSLANRLQLLLREKQRTT